MSKLDDFDERNLEANCGGIDGYHPDHQDWNVCADFLQDFEFAGANSDTPNNMRLGRALNKLVEQKLRREAILGEMKYFVSMVHEEYKQDESLLGG